MKHFYILLAALVCCPLLAQNPAKLPSYGLNPKHELELRQHLAEQQRKSQPQSAMPLAERRTPQFKAQSDDALILRDSTVSYLGDKHSLKRVYTYDESGRVTSEVSYRYKYPTEDGIIWEGEQSCNGWDGTSLRFSDTEGYLPTLSDETYESMVGRTMHLDIKAVAGEGTTIRVMNGWWSEIYVPDTQVKAGDTFSFEFTPQMAYDMKNGGEGKDLLFISNNGLTITKFYFDVEEGVKEMLSTKKEYKYDALGNSAGYMEYYWENDDWTLISSSNYNETLYDENGREIGFFNGYWGAKSEYLKDADGKEIGYLYYTLQDGEWTLLNTIGYTFDANGDITGGIIYSPMNGEWIAVSKFESTFDANGREISEVGYVLNDAEWVASYKNEYAYDAYGNLILNARYYWQDGKWVASSIIEYAYDEHGNQTYNSFSYELSNGEWFNSVENKLDYTYDANDSIICQIHSQKFGDTWEEVGKYEYTYNANGNMIFQIHFKKSGGTWKEYSKYDYIYDANDNISKCEYFVKTDYGWELRERDYYSDHHANSIEQVKSESRNVSRKVMKDGKLLIMKEGCIYNIQGQKVEMK